MVPDDPDILRNYNHCMELYYRDYVHAPHDDDGDGGGDDDDDVNLRHPRVISLHKQKV